MICPSCQHTNIEGEDVCENCGEDLANLDGLSKRGGLEKTLMEDPISTLAPRRAVVLSRGDSVLEAVRKMNHSRIGCVVVSEEAKVVGILTERDVLYKLLGKHQDLSRVQVGSVMTANPETLAPADSIAYALNKMAVGGFRHIPIVAEEGRSLGIVSTRDILKYISEHVEA